MTESLAAAPTYALNIYDRMDDLLRSRSGERDTNRPRATGMFRCSVMCDRQNVLIRAGKIKGEITGESLWNFRRGDQIEDDVMKALRLGEDSNGQLSYKMEEQIELLSLDGEIGGKLDTLLTYPDRTTALVSVKSCQGKKLDRLKKGPDEGHRIQDGRYAYLLDQQHGIKVDRAVILYAAKEVRYFHEDWYDVTPYMEQARLWHLRMKEWWAAYVKDGSLPPERNDWMCAGEANTLRGRWCQMTAHCPMAHAAIMDPEKDVPLEPPKEPKPTTKPKRRLK